MRDLFINVTYITTKHHTCDINSSSTDFICSALFVCNAFNFSTASSHTSSSTSSTRANCVSCLTYHHQQTSNMLRYMPSDICLKLLHCSLTIFFSTLQCFNFLIQLIRFVKIFCFYCFSLGFDQGFKFFTMLFPLQCH